MSPTPQPASAKPASRASRRRAHVDVALTLLRAAWRVLIGGTATAVPAILVTDGFPPREPWPWLGHTSLGLGLMFMAGRKICPGPALGGA